MPDALLVVKEDLGSETATELIYLTSSSAQGISAPAGNPCDTFSQPVSLLQLLNYCPDSDGSDTLCEESESEDAEPPSKRACPPVCIQMSDLVIAPAPPRGPLVPSLLLWPTHCFEADLSLRAPSGASSQLKPRLAEPASSKSRSAGSSPLKSRPSAGRSPLKCRSAGASPAKRPLIARTASPPHSRAGEAGSAEVDDAMWRQLRNGSRVIYAADIDESDGPSFFAGIARQSGAAMIDRCQQRDADDDASASQLAESDSDNEEPETDYEELSEGSEE